MMTYIRLYPLDAAMEEPDEKSVKLYVAFLYHRLHRRLPQVSNATTACAYSCHRPVTLPPFAHTPVTGQ